MMWLWIFLWWLSGVVSMLVLPTGRALTWGHLAFCIVLGWFGPAVWLVVAVVALTQAEFWNKPIYKQKPGKGA